MSRTRWPLAVAFVGVLALVGGIVGCSSSDGSSDGSDPATGDSMTISVPEDHETIQGAVDAARPGSLILVSPGTYNEQVEVSTENVTIRGLDRNTVILDGEFDLENGVRALDTDGLVVENLTTRNMN